METNDLVVTFQLQLKEKIIKNMVLERDSTRGIMHNELCASILQLQNSTWKPWEIIPNKSCKQAGGNAILQHHPSATLELFTTLLRTVNSIAPDTQATSTLAPTQYTMLFSHSHMPGFIR
jgi:hypothetical protein